MIMIAFFYFWAGILTAALMGGAYLLIMRARYRMLITRARERLQELTAP